MFCYLGQVVGGPGPPDPKSKLVYHVTNTGRRPILVTHIGGAYAKDHHFMLPTRVSMPKMLQPGEYILEYSEDLSILDEKPNELWAIDSLGKHWKVSRKQLQYLLSERKRKKLQQT